MQESNTSKPYGTGTSPNYLHDLLLDRDHADPADLPAAEFSLEQSVRWFPGRTVSDILAAAVTTYNLFLHCLTKPQKEVR